MAIPREGLPGKPGYVKGGLTAASQRGLRQVSQKTAAAAAAGKQSTSQQGRSVGGNLAAQAATQAQDQIDAMVAPITTQRTEGAQQAVRDAAALQGINTASTAALRTIAPSIEGAYGRAADETRALSSGYSQEMQNRLQAGNDTAAQMAAAQGITPPPGTDLGPNAGAVADTYKTLGGTIPGSSLAAQAAHTSAYGAGLVASNISAGKIAVQERQAQQITDDAKFRNQIANIIAKYPQLEQAALTALQNYELKVEAENRAIIAANNLTSYRNATLKQHDRSLDQGDTRLENQHEHNIALEGIADQGLQISRGHLNVDWENARISNARLLDTETQARIEGRKLDKNMSLVAGYAVDSQRRPILDKNGNTVPVDASMFSVASTTNTPAAKAAKSFQSAVSDARILRGSPVKSTLNPALGGGAYIAAPGATGPGLIKVPGLDTLTTNNPKQAVYDTQYSFAEALNYLVQRRGLARAKARRALIAAGWKPDGKRPSSTPITDFGNSVANTIGGLGLGLNPGLRSVAPGGRVVTLGG